MFIDDCYSFSSHGFAKIKFYQRERIILSWSHIAADQKKPETCLAPGRELIILDIDGAVLL